MPSRRPTENYQLKITVTNKHKIKRELLNYLIHGEDFKYDMFTSINLTKIQQTADMDNELVYKYMN